MNTVKLVSLRPVLVAMAEVAADSLRSGVNPQAVDELTKLPLLRRKQLRRGVSPIQEDPLNLPEGEYRRLFVIWGRSDHERMMDEQVMRESDDREWEV